MKDFGKDMDQGRGAGRGYGLGNGQGRGQRNAPAETRPPFEEAHQVMTEDAVRRCGRGFGAGLRRGCGEGRAMNSAGRNGCRRQPQGRGMGRNNRGGGRA